MSTQQDELKARSAEIVQRIADALPEGTTYKIEDYGYSAKLIEIEGRVRAITVHQNTYGYVADSLKIRVHIEARYKVVKQFPQRKDGSHNIEAIVDTMLSHQDDALKQQAFRKAQAHASAEACAFLRDIDAPSSMKQLGRYGYPEVEIYLTLRADTDEEKAKIKAISDAIKGAM